MGRIYDAMYGREESTDLVAVDNVWVPEPTYTVDTLFWPLEDHFVPVKSWSRQLKKTSIAISDLLQHKQDDHYCVMITGFVDNSDTSEVAKNLASTMNMMEDHTRVLVMEFSASSQPSDSSLLRQLSHTSADHLLSVSPPPGVYSVDVGLSLQDVKGVGLPAGLKDFITHAKKHFDRVVLDAPTFGKHSVCDALGRVADGAVVVVPCSRTRLPALRAVQTDMEHLGINLLGVVLNQRQYPLPKWLLRFI